jgi:hopanoid biosynthesis associated radical SAM protein HpnH
MRFPFSLTRSLAGYLLKMRLSGRERFPLVLMIEPSHACNLRCKGCGRIREYAGTVQQRMSIDECLAAVDECGAPVVSVCGGEPLVYPGIERLVAEIVARRKHVYLCTNGLELAGKIARFRPSGRLFFSIHLDGMEATHDAVVQRPGVFRQAIAGIRAAKQAGFRVTTNTTVYRQTDMDEIVVLLEYLTELGVDGMMITPAYGYEAVEKAGNGAATLFMTREEIQSRFRRARSALKRFRLVASPIYLDFLCGLRTLPCAAWASPTRNVRGWKGPCYLMTDAHWPTYQDLVDSTDWSRLGPGRDPRCQHCLVHCGFEPAAMLSARWGLRDALAMALWQVT